MNIKKSPWLKRLIILAILACLIVALITFFRMRGVAANVVTAESGPIKQTLVFSARVSSVARSDIAATSTARVEKVLVKEGDRVKAGQLLIELDDDESRAQVAQARATLTSALARLRAQGDVAAPVANQAVRQAENNLDFAKRELERQRALFNQGFIGQARLQDAERAATNAESALAQSRAQASGNASSGAETAALQARLKETEASVALAQARLGALRIVAPAAGKIVLRSVEPGDVVQPAKRLLALAVDGETRLVAQIDEKNLALLREGMTALASSDAFPDKPFPAQLNYIAPAADAARGTVEARLVVKEPPPFLRDDMTVSVEVITAQKSAALTLPPAAVREFEGKTQVLVADGGEAKAQAVRVGIRTPQRVEILEGLSSSASVIIDPAIQVGQRVRPQTKSKIANPGFDNPMNNR